MTLELTQEEQETSINQSADNRGEWNIVTDDPVWQRRLAKLGFKPTRERGPTQWFIVPANAVIVRKPPPPKQMTDEQRAIVAARLRDARKPKGENIPE